MSLNAKLLEDSIRSLMPMSLRYRLPPYPGSFCWTWSAWATAFLSFSCLNYITLQIHFFFKRSILHHLALTTSTASALALPVSPWIPLAWSQVQLKSVRGDGVQDGKFPEQCECARTTSPSLSALPYLSLVKKRDSRGAGSLDQRQRISATYSAIHPQCSRLADAVSLMTGGSV